MRSAVTADGDLALLQAFDQVFLLGGTFTLETHGGDWLATFTRPDTSDGVPVEYRARGRRPSDAIFFAIALWKESDPSRWRKPQERAEPPGVSR